ncbi:MAG: hypothetical protein JSW21_02915 [Gammaproteobacteria bacterium]|nr:MAG: hypothetical protein JSW21_02915 [Gammaproteobacteria bacterium]
MKSVFVIAALVMTAAVVYLSRNHADYGNALPPGLPTDVPIVAGTVLSSRRTLFEDGMGYVLDLQTDLSYEEVVEFYRDMLGIGWIADAPGMGAQFSVGRSRLGDTRVFLEIHSSGASTHVTLAVHLGRWW